MGGARLRNKDERHDEEGNPDGNVNQEDGAPSDIENIAGDQGSTDQWPGDGGQAGDRTQGPKDGRALLGGKQHLNNRENLRNHQGGKQSLDDTRDNEHVCAHGPGAGGRRHGEGR